MGSAVKKILSESIELYEQNHFHDAEKKVISIFKDKNASVQELGNAYYLYAVCEHALLQYDHSFQLAKKSYKINPKNYELLSFLGLYYSSLGDSVKSEDCYRKSIEIKENFSQAWLGLASCKQYTDPEDKDLKALRKLLVASRKENDEESQANMCFALGKICDDLKKYSEAIQYFFEGNFLKRKRFDSGQYEIDTNKAIKLFTKEYINKFRRDPVNPDFKPIFIVGMPRSGTTLVEQILACHSKVYAAGEDASIAVIGGKLSLALKVKDRWTAYEKVDIKTLDKYADSYKKKFFNLAGASKPFIVNKTPGNYMNLGLIKLLFPNAKIIHVCRHPGDTCVSCFFQTFIQNNEYAFEATHLGYFYRKYIDYMQHWWKTLGDDFIFNLPYEVLVNNSEEKIHQLLDFCGLDREPACLEHDRLRRYVATASRLQVIQPIYQSSIGRWKHYCSWLEELLNINDLIEDYESMIRGEHLDGF